MESGSDGHALRHLKIQNIPVAVIEGHLIGFSCFTAHLGARGCVPNRGAL